MQNSNFKLGSGRNNKIYVENYMRLNDTFKKNNNFNRLQEKLLHHPEGLLVHNTIFHLFINH